MGNLEKYFFFLLTYQGEKKLPNVQEKIPGKSENRVSMCLYTSTECKEPQSYSN